MPHGQRSSFKMKNKLIIIGGGFAGLELAKRLDTNLFDVLLIDKLNHHQFQPLFYQVATAQIEPSSISFPLRYIFRNKTNIQIRMADVLKIQPSSAKISTSEGDFGYDVLVVAVGCTTNYFQNRQIERFSFSLKSTSDAISIRNQILSVFERILSAKDAELEALNNLVIVGAGPTGVELAGAFAEIKRFILPKDYPSIDFSKFSIYLIEGNKDVLPALSEASRKVSLSYLQKMGIHVVTGCFVKQYDGKVVLLSTGVSIPTATLIWAAGVKGNKLQGLEDQVWVANERIRVDRYNQVIGYENIYAIGDIAYMSTPQYPNAHPQVANVAISQAKNLGKNLMALAVNGSLREYEYTDRGVMATIGRNKAVVELPAIKLKGRIAWLIWMFLHLMLILTVRNKIIVFINWFWLYATKNSSLRLILKPNEKY
jgi:NADH dehydrogenase